MKKRIIIYAAVLSVLLIGGWFLFSTDSYDYNFKKPKEAITTCRKDLYALEKKKDIRTSALAKEIVKWMALRDSTLSCIVHADTNDLYNEVFNDFYNVSDSIGSELTRLARSKDRTVEDVIYIQKKTATNRKKTIASENYKNAKAFFENIKSPEQKMSLDNAIKTYRNLLLNTNRITKEQALLKFMETEDQCFQVIMQNLTQVSPNDLEDITIQAERFFSKLMFSLTADNKKADNSRILAYLHMRINKRVITNLKTVCAIIDKNVKLNESQQITYQFMLLQPYMALDNNSWAYMTEQQIEVLEDVAPNIHKYMLKLKSPVELKDKEKEKELENMIGKYLITAYIRQIL